MLANDSDLDGDNLSAQLDLGPSNGTIVFNDDGSFVYSPNIGFTGEDAFSYVASDGIQQSLPATVAITVQPPVTVTDSVTLRPSKDNSLFESATGSLSNGSGEFLFVGKTLQAENSLRRGLLAFDFSSIPAGATITSATLTLNMSRTIVGPFDVTLHRVLQNWGEGSSDAAAEEGTGITATPDDATWIHSFFDSQSWTTPGGDFETGSSATTTVDQSGAYTWNSPQMITDVQGWLDAPSTNAGWMLLTDENDVSAKRFDSRENSTEANRPRLVVEYEVNAVSQGAGVGEVAGEPSAMRTGSNMASVTYVPVGVEGVLAAPDAPEPRQMPPEILPGDINFDGEVNFQDFLVIASNFSKTDAVFADGDFDGSDTVDFGDFLLLAANFGRKVT